MSCPIHFVLRPDECLFGEKFTFSDVLSKKFFFLKKNHIEFQLSKILFKCFCSTYDLTPLSRLLTWIDDQKIWISGILDWAAERHCPIFASGWCASTSVVTADHLIGRSIWNWTKFRHFFALASMRNFSSVGISSIIRMNLGGASL